jgi:hypothetical protein
MGEYTLQKLQFAHALAKQDVSLIRPKKLPSNPQRQNQDTPSNASPIATPHVQQELISAISQVLEIQEKQQTDLSQLSERLAKVVDKVGQERPQKRKVIKPVSIYFL